MANSIQSSAQDKKLYLQKQSDLSRNVVRKTEQIKKSQQDKQQEEKKNQEQQVMELVCQYEINQMIINQLTIEIEKAKEMAQQSEHHEKESKEFWDQYKEREDNIARVDDRDIDSIQGAMDDLSTQMTNIDERIVRLNALIASYHVKIAECDQKIDAIDARINELFGPPPDEQNNAEWIKSHSVEIARAMAEIYRTSSEPDAKEKLNTTLMEGDFSVHVKQRALAIADVFYSVSDSVNGYNEEKLATCKEKVQQLPQAQQKNTMELVEKSLARNSLVKEKNTYSVNIKAAEDDLKKAQAMKARLEEQGKELNVNLEAAKNNVSRPVPGKQ